MTRMIACFKTFCRIENVKPVHFNAKGFTLVEMMVVVAIIGVLSVVAKTNYDHFVAKARQAEAKIGLAALYTAESSFFAEKNSYTSCLRQIGYVHDTPKRYYRIGFSYATASTSTCGPSGNIPCNNYDFNGAAPICNAADPDHDHSVNVDIGYFATAFAPTSSYYTRVSDEHFYQPNGIQTQVSTNTFIAGAGGSISSSPPNSAMLGRPDNVNSGHCCDGWQIDQNKVLINSYPGI
ncbi:MAG: type IV pilin protein [Bdellovibrionia bacterium]